MALELKVPEVGESITEVMIGTWKKREGDTVAIDDSIVEIESDKATVELPAPTHGTITKILKAAGEKAVVGEVIGYLEPAAVGAAAPAPPAAQPAPTAAAAGKLMGLSREQMAHAIGMAAVAKRIREAGSTPGAWALMAWAKSGSCSALSTAV